MTAEGGKVDDTHLFCTVIDEAADVRVAALSPESLTHIVDDRFEQGFTYLLLPAFSNVHRRYALDAAAIPAIYNQPIMGWVTGVHLSEIGKESPKVFNGLTGEFHDNRALVLHVGLKPGFEAEVNIVNLFDQGTGPAIVFPRTDLFGTDCTIDGKPANFGQWLKANAIDTKLPLVANYSGAMVNVSVQDVDAESGRVAFYAPVIAGETYRIARPVTDYGAAYAKGLEGGQAADDTLSCNCVLNYLYAGLEGKTTHGFVGPVTFGEIAYILLNQTLVGLDLRAIPAH
jgi:hypothetical protein